MNDFTTIYGQAIEAVSHTSCISRTEKQKNPKNFIVATHGPALVRAVCADPTILDAIGIYRVNCSHLGKEGDWQALAQYLRVLHPYVPILIDLQWPKPRIHEFVPECQDKIEVIVGKVFHISYAPDDAEDRFCTADHLRVCFPEITACMQVGDSVVFDDGKMTAEVREVGADYNTIACVAIEGDKTSYMLKGKKGVCVRNRPLGIDCVTPYDHTCIEFARDMLGFEYADWMLVSYFLHERHIADFVRILREEYQYAGTLAAKFETPLAVFNAEAILSQGHITLAMLWRGDLRVEMDLRAIPNMHRIQSHFFAICQKHGVESICATGFLESMMTPDGAVTPSEIGDMQISMRTGADHLMLSAESSYGAQSAACIRTEVQYQRDMVAKILAWEVSLIPPESDLATLLFLNKV